MKLYAPRGYWELSEEEKNQIVNGCGSSQAKFDFVPDTIWGLDISPACQIHDYCYHIALPRIDQKEQADRIFLNNMNRLIEENTKSKMLKWLRRSRAKKYYQAVKYFGGSAFWEGKQ